MTQDLDSRPVVGTSAHPGGFSGPVANAECVSPGAVQN